MFDTRKSGLIQSSPPSLSRNELYVNQGGAGEIKPGVRLGGASNLDKFSNSNDLAEVNSETVVTVPRMVQQPTGGAFSVGDHVVLVAEAVGDNQDGGNAVVNGTFATDTDWTKGTGWTIAAGVASCDGTQVGVTQLLQGSTLVSGVSYQVTYTVSNYVAGIVAAAAGATVGTPRSADGTFTQVLIANATGAIIEGDIDFVGDIDLVSFVAVPFKQWQLDASDIIGENDATLVLANIQIADAGTYTCDFFNGAGKTSSAAAVVTVT